MRIRFHRFYPQGLALASRRSEAYGVLIGMLCLVGCGYRSAFAQTAAPQPIPLLPALLLKPAAGSLTAIESVAFSPDGKRIMTGSADRTVLVWDARNGHQRLALPGLRSKPYSVVLSSDGRCVATGNLNFPGRPSITVWDVATGRQAILLNGHPTLAGAIAFSPDGKKIFTAYSNWTDLTNWVEEDNAVIVWDAQTGHPLLNLIWPHSEIRTAVFSSDSLRILTSSLTGPVCVWDARTGRLLRTITPPDDTPITYTAEFSPDGNFIVTGEGRGDGGGQIVCWNAHTGDPLWTAETPHHHAFCVAFGPRSDWFVTGNDDETAEIQSAQTGQELYVLQGNRGHINSLRLSSDGNRIVAGSDDATACVWQTPPVLFRRESLRKETERQP